jgi:pyruvate dehydrogenase E2 component (dihydrolipoamide acetyltransferase)
MPQLGISEESAILTAWHVRQGDAVGTGDKLFSIETGKSSFDVESEYAGTVLHISAAEGDEVAVKAPVCVIGEAGEDCPAYAGVSVATHCVDAVGCSPRAGRLAEKMGVDPAAAVPTGPGGRVIERDVRALQALPQPPLATTPSERESGLDHPPEYTDRPLSHMRKIIAKNMLASLRNTAQLTHNASFDATAVLTCRKQFKEDPATAGVTLTDILLYTVSRTLKDFPALNAWLLDDTLRVFSEVSLAAAVDTERGLMVPVIFNASQKTLTELSDELKSLAEQCRAGSISPDLLSGGSFTVSNLGQFGIESFTPVLNAPQTGILGVNTVTHRVREDGTPYPCMTLSLTYDHRALDGAPASRFLQALCKSLESFTPPPEAGI